MTLNTAIIVFVYCLAIVVTLIFEMPYVNLATKLLKPKPKPKNEIISEMQSEETILNKTKSMYVLIFFSSITGFDFGLFAVHDLVHCTLKKLWRSLNNINAAKFLKVQLIHTFAALKYF